MRRKIHRAPMAVASALLLGVFATSCSTEDPTDSASGTDESSETSESPDAAESPEEDRESVLLSLLFLRALRASAVNPCLTSAR